MKIIIAIISTILLMLILFVGIPYIRGYKIFYSTDVIYDYQAIAAYGQWVSALVPVAVVFLSVYVTNLFDKTKNEINKQNIATVEYVNDMIRDLKQSLGYASGSTYLIDNENLNLKDKAYKYVSIAGFTKTENVAKHLGVSKEEAYDILIELLKVDNKISAGGRTTKDNIDNIIWLKKKRN